MALVTVLAGCAKKVKVAAPPLPPITVPSGPVPKSVPEPPAMPPPTSTGPGISEPVPVPDKPATTPRRSIPTRPAPTPATPVPPSTEPDLGNLTEGGASGANTLRTQAQNLISEMDRRLQGLPAGTKQQKGRQLTQVQQFLSEAKEALNTGDVAGANNLATKSKLLLDDLLK